MISDDVVRSDDNPRKVTSLCIVDDQYDSAPEVMKDRFWKKALVEPLYPESTMSDEVRPLVGSAVNAKSVNSVLLLWHIHRRRKLKE
ncbi:hypothetical protein AB6A40_009975 [Gnathostoma spinigerum]|uniref:Uncharacterized protein n=1 Tax=Gnathostoma spinigerum TaxID=75299 RepID=A0ABD6EV94_9BILA